MCSGGGTTHYLVWVPNTCSNGYREMCNTNIIANVFVFQIDPGGKIPIGTYIGCGWGRWFNGRKNLELRGFEQSATNGRRICDLCVIFEQGNGGRSGVVVNGDHGEGGVAGWV